MFKLFRKKKGFFSAEEQQIIIDAIKNAEKCTSGEVRVYVEERCRFIDAIDRAKEIFYHLKMHATEQKNAVLVYVAMKDQQLAVFGDEGIHQKVGTTFWNDEVKKMLQLFKSSDYALGIANIVTAVGAALQQYFPYNDKTDKNELPDDIVFGK